MKNHDFTWSDYHTFSRISGIRTGISGEIIKSGGEINVTDTYLAGDIYGIGNTDGYLHVSYRD